MFRGLKITCDQATTICDKTQYGESTILERVKLQLHFLGCGLCRLYTKQNIMLSKIYKRKAKIERKNNNHICLSQEEKDLLREELKKMSA